MSSAIRSSVLDLVEDETVDGSQLARDHQDAYDNRFGNLLRLAVLGTVIGVNNYEPCFEAPLPAHIKGITFILTTGFFVRDCITMFNRLSHTIGPSVFQKIKDFFSLWKKNPFLTSFDITTVLVSVVMGALSSSSNFANAVDAGAPQWIAFIVWLLQILHLTRDLFLASVLTQKNIAHFLGWTGWSWVPETLHERYAWRRRYQELIDILAVQSSISTLHTVSHEFGYVPELFRAKDLSEVNISVRKILEHYGQNQERRWEGRGLLCLGFIRWLLYSGMAWLCLVFAGTQMGSVYNALKDHIIPAQIRMWFIQLSDVSQDNLIAFSAIAIFIQHLKTSIAAIDTLSVHSVRTFFELIQCDDVWRFFHYLLVLVSAVGLGVFSFSFVFFSATNGMENVNFRDQYENYFAKWWSQVMMSPEGLSALHIQMTVPQAISGLAIVSNSASLIEGMNQVITFLRAGGHFIPSTWTSSTPILPAVHTKGAGADRFKIELLKFLRDADRLMGSRYGFEGAANHIGPSEDSEDDDVMLLPSQSFLPQSMQSSARLATFYYGRTLELSNQGTGNEDELVEMEDERTAICC